MPQSDATQLEAVIAKAKQNGVKTLCMVCRHGEDDDYSASFERFYYFLCREAGMEDYFYATYSDREDENLALWMETIMDIFPEYENPGIFFVPSSPEDMRLFDSIMQKYRDRQEIWPRKTLWVFSRASLQKNAAGHYRRHGNQCAGILVRTRHTGRRTQMGEPDHHLRHD